MHLGDVPEIYRFFVSKTYAVMDLMDYMESRTLCYVGDDLARDCFEFYVRLLYHFEYATHVIVLRQWGVQQAFDAVDVLMRQVRSHFNLSGSFPERSSHATSRVVLLRYRVGYGFIFLYLALVFDMIPPPDSRPRLGAKNMPF